MTPTPYPAPTASTWLLLLAAFIPAAIIYWIPTLLAIWRRNSRMGLVIFYNLGAIMVLPWVFAMTVVLGEPSNRPRAVPVWTPEQAAAWSAPPELPANVTPLRPAAREWGRQ
jgi:hypothetical protein